MSEQADQRALSVVLALMRSNQKVAEVIAAECCDEEVLLELLGSEALSVRRAAAESLSGVKTAIVYKRFRILLLEEDDAQILRTIIASLGLSGLTDVAELIRQHSRHSDWMVRYSSVLACTRLGVALSREELIALLEDEYSYVRSVVREHIKILEISDV